MSSPSPPDPATLLALFGTGRSGSTWLGSILNTHREVAYRFEPFHRYRNLPRGRHVRQLIESDTFSDAHLGPVLDLLRPADTATDKPPYWDKVWGPEPFKKQAYWICKALKVLKPLFRKAYSPANPPYIAFKEVNTEAVFEALTTRTSVRSTYLIRHPAAVALSAVRGAEQGVMDAGRRGVVAGLLAQRFPELHDRFAPRIPEMSPIELDALLWRRDVEWGLRIALDHPGQVLTIVYEELCEQCLTNAQRMFEHFGLSMPPAARDYLQSLLDQGETAARRRGSASAKAYFNVMRDPRQSRDAWRSRIQPEDQRRVMAVVEDSWAWQWGVDRGAWR